MFKISFHCCVSLGCKGIFCSVHFGKSLKWGCQLWSVFPFWFGFFRFPGNPKGGHPNSCICNPNLFLTDKLYYGIQLGLKREVCYMCECVFLAISPKKCGAGCWEFYLNGDQGSSYGPAGDGFQCGNRYYSTAAEACVWFSSNTLMVYPSQSRMIIRWAKNTFICFPIL